MLVDLVRHLKVDQVHPARLRRIGEGRRKRKWEKEAR
jgi:hypothetical protein